MKWNGSAQEKLYRMINFEELCECMTEMNKLGEIF